LDASAFASYSTSPLRGVAARMLSAWQGPTNTLYYGDNLDVLRRHVADKSVDLVYKAKWPQSVRITTPRLLIALYEIRNIRRRA
jgi:hypothetical protein